MRQDLATATSHLETATGRGASNIHGVENYLRDGETVYAVALVGIFNSHAVAVVTDTRLFITTSNVISLPIVRTTLNATQSQDVVHTVIGHAGASYEISFYSTAYGQWIDGFIRAKNGQEPRGKFEPLQVEQKLDTPDTLAGQSHDKQAPGKGHNNPALGCLGILAVIVLGAFLFSSCDEGGSTPSPNTREAERMCEESISGALRAPSTASYSHRVQTHSTNANDYRILVDVDAQNGFGAMVRETYSCKLLWHPSTRSWDLTSVTQQPF
ncbi:hypothetical protein IW252_001168 [Zhihengliuella flava]|uniref:Uncharacterized protein n=1 Tax=Zhihengliuella flava TaxID=1285193 RepID=A0A931DBJ8_9MICC|nr:hypothetical protein [Zhihengliuella flava]